eukprot:105546_1
MFVKIKQVTSKCKLSRFAEQIPKYQRHFNTSSSSSAPTALVTGGNRGIGLQACKQLHDNGFNVIMGTRDLTKGAEAISSCFNNDANINLLSLDISDPYSVSDAVKYIEHNYDNIDVLVNNAGSNLDNKSNKIISQKDKIINTIQTNYYGT